MIIENNKVTLSPTDLTDFTACHHLITLKIRAAKKEIKEPYNGDPILEQIRLRGLEFEKHYIEHLKKSTTNVVDLTNKSFHETIAAMRSGADVIIQARLNNKNWTGKADILIKVPKASQLGSWSYEVQDTKLSQKTRNSAVLQLCFYSGVVSEIQGVSPDIMKIVKPGDPFTEETYRFDDFKSYFRSTQKNLEDFISIPSNTYPDPVDHCTICNWWNICKDKRRNDDHLSLVAGILSSQTEEIIEQGLETMESFAQAKEIRRPKRGNLKNLENKQKQAILQVSRRQTKKLTWEFIPLKPSDNTKPDEPDEPDDHGFNLLPNRNEGDIYFDFEGDPFFEGGGIEYLFGFIYKNSGNQWVYEKYWAKTKQEEKAAFQKFMVFVSQRLLTYPELCIYHYSHKEPTSFKRLMREHACFEDEVNKLLRGLRFVDLRSVFKKAIRAGVEQYSLKDLEKYAKYERQIELDKAGPARREVELAINSADYEMLTEELKELVNQYNEDDCRATMALHEWIENKRSEFEKIGNKLNRLEINSGELEEKENQKQRRQDLKKLSDSLRVGLPLERHLWTSEHHANVLLANLLFYFQREIDSSYWELYATLDKDVEDLEGTRNAISDVVFQETLPLQGKQVNPVEIYVFGDQEVSVKVNSEVFDFETKKSIGTVDEFNPANHTISIKRKPKNKEIRPANIVFRETGVNSDALVNSLMELAQYIVTNGLKREGSFSATIDLLCKHQPSFIQKVASPLPTFSKQGLVDSAIQLAKLLNNSILALQGPPGTGKTHTGAEMILALHSDKKKIGITAVSHKAYQNLMQKVKELAANKGIEVKLAIDKKKAKEPNGNFDLFDFKETKDLKKALEEGFILGDTAWLWASDKSKEQLDYLFVDEAGQMSLAYVLAIARSAKNLILLGDPNQLEQPQKGTHPEGSDVAALAHLLDGHKTMPDDRGIFMNTTWRLHPAICAFTSEQFYESKLNSVDGLEKQLVTGKTNFNGSGLFYVPAIHKGNQTSSSEEIKVIKQITDELLANGSYNNKSLTLNEILIVAPYNSQVNELKLSLPDFRIGTVDKFQGQEAPVVIYSMTSSSIEDTPRGMGFLFDPNRFNVATSRARSICILVASPRLFEAECKSIDQMRWANVLCRYREMAKVVALKF